MNRLLLSLTLCMCAVAGQAAEPWAEFTSKEGKYTAVFPGAVQEVIKQVQTPVGPGKTWQVMMPFSGAAAADSACGVICTEYPVPTIDPAETSRLLDSARDGSTRVFNGTIRSESEIQLGPHTGREVIMESGQTVVQTRYYWVSPRLYQVMVVTSTQREAEIASDTNAFFESFKILE